MRFHLARWGSLGGVLKFGHLGAGVGGVAGSGSVWGEVDQFGIFGLRLVRDVPGHSLDVCVSI